LVLGWQASGGFTGRQGAIWVAAVFAASASWQLLLAGGGALIGRTLNTPKGRLWTALVSSAMIATLALAVIVG
jgi:arginine exporter protein ArgO